MSQAKHEPRSFEEFLKERKQGDDEVDCTAVRELWQRQAKALVDLVAGWLRPLEAKRLVRIENAAWQLTEEALGPYELPGLKLHFPQSPLVVLRPAGKHIIGAAGRYDLECGPEKYLVLLSGNGQWRIVHSTRRQKPMALDKGAFEAAVQELVSR